MPSPFGEGQTDTPISHHPLGEVPLPSPVWIFIGAIMQQTPVTQTLVISLEAKHGLPKQKNLP